MVDLGLGKNMVRSARFWALTTGVAAPAAKGDGYSPTDFGSMVLGTNGADPFLEDIRTLWLIHWRLSTEKESPLLAWHYLFNHWQEPDLIPSAALKSLQKEAAKHDASLSPVTLEQHFETFLHTYVPTRGRKGEVLEDNLDCPLVELELITRIGERPTDDGAAGRMEPIYAFRREEKPDITNELFLYCLNDFWEKWHSGEKTLRLRDVAHGPGGLGQVFKLPEEDVRNRADSLSRETDGRFSYTESANSQLIHRTKRPDTKGLLLAVYNPGGING